MLSVAVWSFKRVNENIVVYYVLCCCGTYLMLSVWEKGTELFSYQQFLLSSALFMIAFDEFLGGWEKRSLSPGKLDLWHASTTVANFKMLWNYKKSKCLYLGSFNIIRSIVLNNYITVVCCIHPNACCHFDQVLIYNKFLDL